ncbi:redoxin domain-containing protein [Streptomyces sp. NBC_00464]|uniref:redoxin domain-containing protein n=1 Tax=Streptomyces sp. NBC_00464 TaxID=2975751 RepID=UPI002E17E9EB
MAGLVGERLPRLDPAGAPRRRAAGPGGRCQGHRPVLLPGRPAARARCRTAGPASPGHIGCTLENQLFRDAYDDFRAAGAEVRGVSTQRPSQQRVFAVGKGIPFTLLSDVDLRLAAALPLCRSRCSAPGRHCG